MKKLLFYSLSLLFLAWILVDCNSNANRGKAEEQQEKNTVAANLVPQDNLEKDIPLDKIKLPEGFKISVFAKVDNARSLALGAKGTVFVGNREKDKVYAIKDNNGDFKADEVYVIASKLNMPCGVAFKDGSLYIAEVNRIIRLDDIEEKLKNPPKPVLVYDKLPSNKWHGWKFIAFGPEGKLYVPVGAPCNVCERKEQIYASICRMNPDGSEFELFASGVRNSVGFDWNPDNKELWFTENGRDMMGDDRPDDELNRAPQKGMHFGFPYCHAGEVKDDEFGNKRPCADFTAPVQKLGAHVAALGMRFYQGKMFPEIYQKQIFIAKHGSWNRSRKSGYELSTVKLEGNKAVEYKSFASGWLDEKTQKVWGRPVDVLILPDGSMLVSDDTADVVYRIWYEK